MNTLLPIRDKYLFPHTAMIFDEFSDSVGIRSIIHKGQIVVLILFYIFNILHFIQFNMLVTCTQSKKPGDNRIKIDK
ncbi:hypothetical protein YH65_00545 [Sulfurovum lithotrophicum]|uniref:Uncharacterized protein n=1 Tax=Sulfurovum lithotrophicum TaxID=206403 RepID=A0A7U4LZI1_9BACT|nr:hypothetical protein YH65_00545 [Sulfurovum lithotrophicum]